MNRVFLHLHGCRCARAQAYVAAAEEVAETIEGVINDEDLISFCVPTAAEYLAGEPVTFHVRGDFYSLDSIDTAAAEVAEVLAGMAARLSQAAAKLQGGAR